MGLQEPDAADAETHADTERSAPVTAPSTGGPEEQLARLFDKVEAAPSPPRITGLCTARVVSCANGMAELRFRGQSESQLATLDAEVEEELVLAAARDRQAVLVEVLPGALPVVVGIVQTRVPREVELRADSVTIEGKREVLLRAGRAAVRLRDDGEIEVVGGRISAMSRGLFRIVGRVLRLN